MEVPLGEGPQVLFQPLVGRQMQHLMRLTLAAFLFRRAWRLSGGCPNARKGRIPALQGDPVSFRLLDLPHLNAGFQGFFRHTHEYRFLPHFWTLDRFPRPPACRKSLSGNALTPYVCEQS